MNKITNKVKPNHLFQSELWEKFQKIIPGKEKTWRIDNALLVKHKLPLNLCWIECPRGPIFNYSNEKKIKQWLQKVCQLAKKERAVFLRIDPPVREEDSYVLPKEFKKAHAQYFPQCTIHLDLTLSEEALLKQMKPKGRYNIKVAAKHGVQVREVAPEHLEGGGDEFYKLLSQTAKRDQFHVSSKRHYKDMLEVLGSKHAKLWLAEHEGRPIAGLVATYYGDTVTYYYGAFSHENRALMAPYLLHWKVMKDAKNRGYAVYDLFGIAPEGNKEHPWQGVTQFKKKFGGEVVCYHQAREYVFKPVWYWIVKVVKTIKKVRSAR